MDSRNSNKYSVLRLSLFIFECVMAVLYIAASVTLLFTSFFSQLTGGLRTFLGVALGLYGLFRVYRAYSKITQRNE
jgi:hypothetical protein